VRFSVRRSILGSSADSFGLFSRELRYLLISLRMEKKLNFTEASQGAGLSRNGLEKIETGAALPSLESLFLLCNFYEISLVELLSLAAKKHTAKKTQKSAQSKRTLSKISNKKRAEENFAQLVVQLKKQKQWQLSEKILKLSPKKQKALSDLLFTG
jgi:transcriptional regulator with XRE-family HTH domain